MMPLFIDVSLLLLLDLNCVAIGVTHDKSLREPELPILIRNYFGRKKTNLGFPHLASSCPRVVGQQDGLPVHDVIRALVRGKGATVAGRKVLEQLDARTAGTAQRRNA